MGLEKRYSMYDKIVAYDLETTGFVPSKSELLEIGAVAFFPITKERRFFSVLIKTSKRIPSKISEITGISAKTYESEDSMLLKQALIEFIEFINEDCKKALIVGHNIKAFDNKFINHNLVAARLPQIKDKDCWDTIIHLRKDIASERSKNLARTEKQKANLLSACKYYSVNAETISHRALPDAINALNVFLKQNKRSRSSKKIWPQVT